MKRTLAVLTLAASTAFAVAIPAAAQTPDDYKVNQSGAQKITNGPVIEYTSDHSAMIAWSTKMPAGTYIAYGTDRNNLSQRTERAWGGTNHRLEIKNLQPGTTYYFQVRSEDANGHGAMGADVESTVASFTTQQKGQQPDRANRNVGVNGSGSSAVSNNNGSMNTTGSGQYAPIYRLFNGSDHMLTTNSNEHSSLTSNGSFHDEGTIGYLATSQMSGTQPFYRLYNPNGNDHIYTANASERQALLGRGFRDEGVIGYIAQSQMSGTQPLYRLSSPNGDHLYTTNANEAQSAQSSKGYRSDGDAGYVWSNPQQ